MTEIIRIPNIENYDQSIMDGVLILTPKRYCITESEINNLILKKSVIKECVIKDGNTIISNKTLYRSILIDIWKSMPTQLILQHTTFNIKLSYETGAKGYAWCPDINMSFQGKDSKGSFREIKKMIKLNNYSLEIYIQLETGRIIYFNM